LLRQDGAVVGPRASLFLRLTERLSHAAAGSIRRDGQVVGHRTTIAFLADVRPPTFNRYRYTPLGTRCPLSLFPSQVTE